MLKRKSALRLFLTSILLLSTFSAPAFGSSKILSLTGYPPDFKLEQPIGNIVVKTINKRIGLLPQPSPSQTWNVSYVVEPGVPQTYLDSLKKQVQYFSAAYSSMLGAHSDVLVLYLNHDFAVSEFKKRNCYVPQDLLDKSAGRVGPSSESSNCNEDFQQGISALNVAAFAKFDPAPKRDPRYTDNWEYQIGQENGGTYLQVALNSGVLKGDQGLKWFQRMVALPAWYEQGGQFGMSSYALAVTTKTWRQSSLFGGNYYSGCATTPLQKEEFYDDNGCHYTGGSAATELMVALYGFDSLVRWFQNAGTDTTQDREVQRQNWAKTFQATFGDSLSQFYRWADQYSRYIDTGRPLGPDLLKRLNSIRS